MYRWPVQGADAIRTPNGLGGHPVMMMISSLSTMLAGQTTSGLTLRLLRCPKPRPNEISTALKAVLRAKGLLKRRPTDVSSATEATSRRTCTTWGVRIFLRRPFRDGQYRRCSGRHVERKQRKAFSVAPGRKRARLAGFAVGLLAPYRCVGHVGVSNLAPDGGAGTSTANPGAQRCTGASARRFCSLLDDRQSASWLEFRSGPRSRMVCRELSKPLLVFEGLRCDYPWASDRLHACVLQGMAANRQAFAARPGVTYFAYVEPYIGAGKGLLETLAADAAVAVTDEYPCFFLPDMIEAAGRALPRRLESVDSNGVLPLRATDRAFNRAHDFRRFLQKNLKPHLQDLPCANPFDDTPLPPAAPVPVEVRRCWSPVEMEVPHDMSELLDALPIDHSVPPTETHGGHAAAQERLRTFIERRLVRYGEARNHPDDDASSGFSPWLHFGHLSAHQVLAEIGKHQGWSVDHLPPTGKGSRAGWWRMSESAESFLDQVITWRELGFNMCCHRRDYDQYDSLPAWARQTLSNHEHDRREHIYTFDELDSAQTHDAIWNAAQRQLRETGRMHNYLRMLWGKKVLEWSPSPKSALGTLIELNNRYALDGRDPNSYSGIFWVLGRYDRAWGPERPIFGTVRYMSSQNAKRKLHMADYLQRWGGQSSLDLE